MTTNREKIQRLQRLVGGCQGGATAEDRAILERLPIVTQATYSQGDQWDSLMTRSRLRTCGSIVESVGLDVASELLRERVV